MLSQIRAGFAGVAAPAFVVLVAFVVLAPEGILGLVRRLRRR